MEGLPRSDTRSGYGTGDNPPKLKPRTGGTTGTGAKKGVQKENRVATRFFVHLLYYPRPHLSRDQRFADRCSL